jgi:mycothiol synthase
VIEHVDARAAREALEALGALERADAVPRIDAAELRRLEELARGGDSDELGGSGDWRASIVHAASGRWYLGVRDVDGKRTAELGRLEHGSGIPTDVLAQLQRERHDLRVWLRAAEDEDVAACVAHGWTVRRELGVLARSLEGARSPSPPSTSTSTEVELRAFRPGADTDEAVRVLRAAHDGHDAPVPSSTDGGGDGGWTGERFEAAARVALHDPADLRVAADVSGRLVGVHWTKRRSATVGEVHNLAIDPSLQGQGLGRRLLHDGLAHLAALGMREVLLWVDLENTPALALYRSEGFVPRARDVALVRTS